MSSLDMWDAIVGCYYEVLEHFFQVLNKERGVTTLLQHLICESDGGTDGRRKQSHEAYLSD